MKKKIAIIVALVILGSLVLCLIGVLFSDTPVDAPEEEIFLAPTAIPTKTLIPPNTLVPTETLVLPTTVLTEVSTLKPTNTSSIKMIDYYETVLTVMTENSTPEGIVGGLLTLKSNISKEPDVPCKEELLDFVNASLDIFTIDVNTTPEHIIETGEIAKYFGVIYILCDAPNQ